MAVFTNDADQTGQTSGTTLTTANSGGGTNTAFGTITGSITVDNGSAGTGALSYLHAAVTATASSLRADFTSQTSGAARIYLYLTAYPTAVVPLIQLGTSGANVVAIRTTGKLYVTTTGTTYPDATNPVPLNTWIRIEHSLSVSASAAVVKADYYLGDSTTPVQTLVDTTTGNTSGTTSVNQVRLGKVTAAGNMGAFRTDGIAWAPAQTTYIGPPAAATTQVTSTRSTTWAANASVTSSRSTAWDVAGVLTSVSSTRSTSWTTRANVTSSRLTTWAVVHATGDLALWLNKTGPRWAAHRDGFYGSPQNLGEFTLAGFQALTAWNRDVAWNIDVFKTSDGEWVASHDQTTGRVLSGTSLDIPTSTWASIQGKTTLVGGNPVARFDDIVAIAPAGTIFFVDNKQNANTSAFFAKIASLGLGPGNVVNKNFIGSTATLNAARAAGYTTWAYGFDGDMTAFANNYALADWLGFDYNGTQANWNTIIGYGRPSFAHILASTANQNTADSKAATAGGSNFGYMVSGVSAVVPQTVVTSSRATTWNAAARVTSTRATTWTASSTVTSQRTTAWNVSGTLTTITSTRATSWDTKQTTASTRQTAWDTRAPVNTQRNTAWDTKVALTSARAALWSTRSQVTSVRVTSWAVATGPDVPARDITATAVLEPRRFTATLTPRRWTARQP